MSLKNSFCLFLQLLTLLILSSCGTSTLDVDVEMPNIRFQTPETTGKSLGGRAQMSLGSAHKISLARSRQPRNLFSSSPSSVQIETNTEYSVANSLGYGADLGLVKWLDLTFSKRGESHFRGGLKAQLFGVKGMTGKGLKIALQSSLGYQKDNDVSRADFLDNKPDVYDNVSALTYMRSVDAALLVGHRFNDTFLIYLNGNWEQNKVESSLSVNGQPTRSMDNTFTQHGLLLGVGISQGEKETKLSTQIEAGLSKLQDRFGHEVNRRAWGVALVMNF